MIKLIVGAIKKLWAKITIKWDWLKVRMILSVLQNFGDEQIDLKSYYIVIGVDGIVIFKKRKLAKEVVLVLSTENGIHLVHFSMSIWEVLSFIGEVMEFVSEEMTKYKRPFNMKRKPETAVNASKTEKEPEAQENKEDEKENGDDKEKLEIEIE